MSITLQHPYAAPTLTLTLRNPELGDADQHDIKTQFNMAMDGTVYSHIETPTSDKLILRFRHITKPKLAELITFIETCAGDEIKLTDWNSTVWRGYLVTEPLEAEIYATLGGTCIEAAELTLEFEGSKV